MGLWHRVILGDFYAAQTQLTREETNVPFVVLGVLVLTFLMALIYPIGYKGGSPIKEGLRFGALIGLIWIFPMSLVMHGVWTYPLTSVIVDSAWHVVEQGVAGLIIGLIYGTQQEGDVNSEI